MHSLTRGAGTLNEGSQGQKLARNKQLVPGSEPVSGDRDSSLADTARVDRLLGQAKWDLGKDLLQFLFRLSSQSHLFFRREPVFLTVRTLYYNGSHHPSEPASLSLKADVLHRHNGAAARAESTGTRHGADAEKFVVLAALSGVAADLGDVADNFKLNPGS